MGNIDERRERSANSEIENKAKLVEKTADEQKSFPYRKVFMGILIALIVVVFAVLIINAMIDNMAGNFPEVDINNASATIAPDAFATKYPEENKFYTAIETDAWWARYLHDQYVDALENYANASSNVVAKDGVYTYILAGINNLTENDTLGTIILMTFDSNTKKVSYATLTNSTLVYIPTVATDGKVGPLGHAYYWGGLPLLARTIQENYGVDVNGYAALGYDVIANSINSTGSLSVAGDQATVDATNAIIAELNKFDKYKDAKIADVTLAEGKITLTGDQTIAYLKSFGDNKSTALKNVVEAYLPALLSQGIGGFVNLVNGASGSVTASVPREDFSALIQMSMNAAAEIGTSETIGDDGIEFLYPNVSGCDYATERANLLKALYGIE